MVPGLEDLHSSGPASHTHSGSPQRAERSRGVFHAISTRLARLAGQTRARLSADAEFAARNGWEIERGRWGARRYRDPRFDQRAVHTAAGVRGRA